MVRCTGHLDNKFKCLHLVVLVSRFCLQAFKVEVWVYRMNANPTSTRILLLVFGYETCISHVSSRLLWY